MSRNLLRKVLCACGIHSYWNYARQIVCVNHGSLHPLDFVTRHYDVCTRCGSRRAECRLESDAYKLKIASNPSAWSSEFYNPEGKKILLSELKEIAVNMGVTTAWDGRNSLGEKEQ